jgi:hypothetical protein
MGFAQDLINLGHYSTLAESFTLLVPLHLRMLWGSYVEESRDRSPLSVHLNFFGRSSIHGEANL